jgi:hypothetical protein
MLELAMAASGPRKIPTVFFKKSDYVPYFHVANNKLFNGPEEDE